MLKHTWMENWFSFLFIKFLAMIVMYLAVETKPGMNVLRRWKYYN